MWHRAQCCVQLHHADRLQLSLVQCRYVVCLCNIWSWQSLDKSVLKERRQMYELHDISEYSWLYAVKKNRLIYFFFSYAGAGPIAWGGMFSFSQPRYSGERIRGTFCNDALYKLTFTFTYSLRYSQGGWCGRRLPSYTIQYNTIQYKNL